jgi:hypothetical protein
LVAVLLAGVVIAGLITVRFSGRPETTSERPASAAQDTGTAAVARATAPVETTSAVVAERAPVPSASSVPAVAREPAKPAHQKRAEPTASASSGAERQICTLTLTANLDATSARVDGRNAALNVPIALPCGRHSVGFQNLTLNEKLADVVELSAGSSRRLLADFNSAKPHIVVVQ